MKELAEASAKQVRTKLQPLLTAYKAWIDAEEARSVILPKDWPNIKRPRRPPLPIAAKHISGSKRA